jgi:mannan endo-1,4-beta-mannosidase
MAFGCAAAPAKSAYALGPAAPLGFEVDGAPLCFVGANNYYLAYQPKPMVDDVLEAARAMGVKVLRVWGFIDRGSLDGSVRNLDGEGSKRGFYFQAWDPVAKRVQYNDGPTGLEGLDYAVWKAGELGLKVVLVATNNWHEFGGMDQYLAWYGLTEHDDFYSEPRVRRAYAAWLSHLALHENSFTHRAYRDDPTVFAWELGNEPRGSAGTPNDTLTDWAREMSSYLKSIDHNHMVAVGDEGFLDGSNQHWTYHAENGVDHRALSALPGIDYATFHMYPDTWGTGFGWDERWIDDHLNVARELGKPTVLEEYGRKVTRDALGRESEGLEARLSSYASWNERLLAHGGVAAMFWMLAGRDPYGAPYPDYDQFTLYPQDASARLLSGFARRFETEAQACKGARRAAAEPPSPFVRVSALR